MGKQVKDFTSTALEVLTTYAWPGNVRELQNVVERAILIAESDVITPDCLPEGIKSDGSFQEQCFDRKLTIEDYTKTFIQRYQTQFNEQQMADMLGITRKSSGRSGRSGGSRGNGEEPGPRALCHVQPVRDTEPVVLRGFWFTSPAAAHGRCRNPASTAPLVDLTFFSQTHQHAPSLDDGRARGNPLIYRRVVLLLCGRTGNMSGEHNQTVEEEEGIPW